MSVLLSAAEQLSVSRARLRQALCQNMPAAPGAAANPGVGASPSVLLDGLKSILGANILFDALVDWWKVHPLRAVGLLAVDAAKSVLQPVAQRHPLGLMLGSFLAGAVLARIRPWRLIPTPALLAGLLPPVLSAAAAAAAAVARTPSRSWIEVLASLAQQYGAPKGPAASPSALSNPTHAQ